MKILSSLLGGLVSIVAGFFGWKKDTADRNNSPEMVKNQEAKDQAKVDDKVNTTINKASKGDEKSLEDLRTLAGE